MRCATAAQFKKKNRRRVPLRVAPREGTHIRSVYDHFYANKGRAIIWERDRSKPNDIRTLADFYGLDIRLVSQGYRSRKSTYVLAGEWFGRVYIDYIAEHLASLERSAA